MFNLFTKPTGEETTKGKILAFLAGIIVASGFIALSLSLDLFSPSITSILGLFFLVITTYEVRKRLAKITEEDEGKP